MSLLTSLWPGPLAYLLVLALLIPFGVHRLYLLWIRWRHGRPRAPVAWDGELPPVTVQVPVYNEANVVERAIDAACRLEYPSELLEVQVLDDSDDGSAALAARAVDRWRARGVDVVHLRRAARDDYKAGALRAGAERASGEFFLVLDADFVPPPGLVRRLLAPFRDPDVGMVQASWGHLNAGAGWLTRAQSLLLDAHFAVEHEARCRAGLFFNFNGTAGMWRRRCLEDAGGWEGDTLTEDLDLSYRAQLAGWRGVYVDGVRVPGELPGDLRALEVQQERWAKGGIQTARKLLPRVWGSGARRAIKLEATAHLLGHLVHPLTVLLAGSLALAGWTGAVSSGVPGWVHGTALAFAVLPFVLYYAVAARVRGIRAPEAARRIAESVTLGIGLGVPLSHAAVAGLWAGAGSEFRRTPKRGTRLLRSYALPFPAARNLVRGTLGILLLGAAARQLSLGHPAAAPFTLLFAAAYLATATASLRQE